MEQLEIAWELDELRALIESRHKLTEKQELEQEMAYLRESSRRLGRKDWLRILLGTLFSYAVRVAYQLTWRERLSFRPDGLSCISLKTGLSCPSARFRLDEVAPARCRSGAVGTRFAHFDS